MTRCDHCHETNNPLIRYGIRRFCVPCLADNTRWSRFTKRRVLRVGLMLAVMILGAILGLRMWGVI